MTPSEQIRPSPGAWPSRPCSLRRTPSRVRTPGPSPLRSLYSARHSGPASRSGAACAPSGVSSCCSSPRAHRALIPVLSPSLKHVLLPPEFLARYRAPDHPDRGRVQQPRPVQVSARYLTSPPSASGPVTRSALGIARRRLARSKQSLLGCRYAPRPGLRAAGSATTSPSTATTRSKSDLAVRIPHPTQVLITDLGMIQREAA
jgi:hypothetical protein